MMYKLNKIVFIFPKAPTEKPSKCKGHKDCIDFYCEGSDIGWFKSSCATKTGTCCKYS